MSDTGVIPLLRRLQEECGGGIPFERFMQEALYHPTLGYYSAKIEDVGTRGDFSTSATLGSELGASIAAWISAKAREEGWRTIPVIEVGAGNGSLAKTILRHLGWRTRFFTRYSIVETSPALRKLQQKKLRFHGIHWHSSVQEALRQSSGRALIFSNELVDAFPCRLFERGEQGWKEVGVRISDDGSLSETLLPNLTSEPWFLTFDHLPVGQRIERHDSYRRWLEEWSPFWKEGSLLTVDYGEISGCLYQRHPRGSLRAYWKHQLLTGRDLYARFGKQDLTADVNFSDLISWGGALGWHALPLVTQREFTEKWVPGKNRGDCSDGIYSPGDAGDFFMVLEQTPNRAGIRAF